MQRLIDATVASMRRIAADLRPVMLDDLGLVPAIDWLVNDFTNRYGIEVERRMDGMHTDFSRDGSTTIVRIVQEALTNVARHSHAAHVALELRQEAEHCIVRIMGDGRGADERADARRKSFGLIGIRERAHRLNGSVSIETSVGQGFTVTVTLPLAAGPSPGKPGRKEPRSSSGMSRGFAPTRCMARRGGTWSDAGGRTPGTTASHQCGIGGECQGGILVLDLRRRAQR